MKFCEQPMLINVHAYIKDRKCAIASPMHTSVCISLLRAASRLKNTNKNNNIDLTNLFPGVQEQFCRLQFLCLLFHKLQLEVPTISSQIRKSATCLSTSLS